MFSCTTCSTSAAGNEMAKHLKATRHKTVRDEEQDEILECEECKDTNIHQLRVLRFGFNDMALLCQSCLEKEEKFAVQYSLDNGSLLKKIGEYFTFRDTVCSECNSDKKLNVLRCGDVHRVVCRLCLPGLVEKYPNGKITSEDDDHFLSELLGLTPFVPSGKSKRKSIRDKGGKRGKRGGARGRASSTPAGAPKSEKDIEADKRREYYFNKLHETKSLKSGLTVSAVGQSDLRKSDNSKDKHSRGKGAKPSGFSKAKSPFAHDKGSGRASPSSRALVKSSPSVSRASPKPSRTVLPSGRHSSAAASREGSSSPKPKLTANGKTKKAIPDPHPLRNDNKVSSSPKSIPNIKKDKDSSKKFSSKQIDVKSKEKAMSKETSKSKDNTKSNDNAISKDASKDKNSSKSKNSKTTSKSNGKSAINSDKNDRTASWPHSKETTPVPSPPKLDLPPGITRYEPSKTPKLSYDSMEAYFKEMSYNLYLEDKIGLESYGGLTIDPEDMLLSWYQDLDKSHKQYKVEIELNDQFMSKLNRKKNLKFKKTIFSVGQTMYLVLDGEIPWYGEIALSETRKHFVKRQKTEIQELIIRLHPWNYQPLPKLVNVKRLTILPASVPISRSFLAMTKIENPKFKKMILGHEPIRQILFNNYIKLSDESKFNQSQKVALQSVLNNSITVLQGPPGTGKTSTIYEIILQLLSNLNTYPILVVAASNIAVDNIAEKLMDTHKMSLLRIVSMEKESDYKSDHKLNSICLHKKVYDMLPDNMKEVHYKLRGPRSNEVSVTQYKKFLSTWIQYSDLIIPQARVIFTTSVAAGGNQLKSMPKFPVVIMDEATQSSEATTLIPLSMSGVEKFVFVGDQKQLSSFTQVPNLSLSLFERVLLNGTYKKPQMLDTQYRMHPMISDFPRNKFYDGLLKDGISAEARTTPGVEKPVLFWDTNGKKREDRIRVRVREDSGYTYVNRGEINSIVEVVTDLIVTKNIAKLEIGIITPYSGQRDLISLTLTDNELINPEKLEIKVEVDRDDIDDNAKPVTIHCVSDIMIASIDAFQGREKDFIIMSCVRSNSEQKIGFLNDARRLNVALTRARCGLILIGDRSTLTHDVLWGEYLEHLSSRGCISTSTKFEY